MRGWILLLVLLAGQALAHSEPVELSASLSPTSGAIQVDVALVGQTSGLPVRSAVLALEVSAAASPDAPVLSQAHLLPTPQGRYTGQLPQLPAGRYVLKWVDTTYRGEAAVVTATWAFDGQRAQIPVSVLPSTSTPPQYLTYALLGLLLPLLGLGLIWAVRRIGQRPRP